MPRLHCCVSPVVVMMHFLPCGITTTHGSCGERGLTTCVVEDVTCAICRELVASQVENLLECQHMVWSCYYAVMTCASCGKVAVVGDES